MASLFTELSAHFSAVLGASATACGKDVTTIVYGFETCILLAAEGYVDEFVDKCAEVVSAILPKVERE